MVVVLVIARPWETSRWPSKETMTLLPGSAGASFRSGVTVTDGSGGSWTCDGRSMAPPVWTMPGTSRRSNRTSATTTTVPTIPKPLLMPSTKPISTLREPIYSLRFPVWR